MAMFLTYDLKLGSFTYLYIWIILIEIYKRREEFLHENLYQSYFWLLTYYRFIKILILKFLPRLWQLGRGLPSLCVCVSFWCLFIPARFWVSSLDLSFMEFYSFSLIFYGKWLSLSLCAKRKHRGERIGGAVLSLQCWWCSSAKYCTPRSGCGSSSR